MKLISRSIVLGSIAIAVVACTQESSRLAGPGDQAMIGRATGQVGQLEDVVRLRRGMYRCEVYQREEKGAIRIANVRIPRPVRRGELDQGMRLVSIQLNQPGGNPPLNLNCGIPRDAEVMEILGGLRYNLAALSLVDPRKYRVYSPAEVELQRARSSDLRQAEKAWLTRPRQNRLTALAGQASTIMFDCVANGGECIGGVLTTADPYNNGPTGTDNGGAGDGGLDGFVGRTEEEFVLSSEEGSGCSGDACNSPAPPGACDPGRDPNCFRVFADSEWNLVNKAESLFVDTSTIADSVTKAECAKAIEWYKAARAGGMWGVGTYDSGHAGATFGGKNHVDPSILDSARTGATGLKELAKTLLHESTHYPGLQFHPGENAPPYANSRYFRHIEELSDSLKSCVK